MDKGKDNDFRYILQTLIKRWYIILLMVLITSSYAYYKIKYKTVTIYEAKSSLMVGNPVGGQGTSFHLEELSLYERYIQTYCALAKTDIVARGVAEKLQGRIPATAIQGAINVSPLENTQFINISVTWGDPKAAMDIINAFSEVFIKEAHDFYPTCTIQVIDSAKGASSIVLSNRSYAMIAPLAGVVLAILMIFGIELFDNTIKTDEDVKEYLKSSVLGEVPKERNMIKKITAETLKEIDPVLLESFRTLRTNIEFITSCNNIKAVAVTSARPGEGKTMTASLLASVMAQAGKKTILIDCDLRNPNVHKLFRIVNQSGLTNYLSGKITLSGAISKGNIDNLYIMTSGIKPPNPVELMDSSSMRSLIKMLRNDYDLIILDTPPVGLVTDAQVLTQFTDTSLFVVSSGKTVKEEAIKAKEAIRQVGGNIMGILLNNAKLSSTYRGYSYYYYGGKAKRRMFKIGKHKEKEEFEAENNIDI